ncbi:MAG TPA: F0F1 ATP synthase subunit A [Candidatus Polarisedimenticolaceae bacterium]|nr:F0F1 ATP synthase subunit A [Candidatus Polarisedimenticolaceae bacterium]
MLSGTETEAAQQAAEHAEQGFDPGSSILHHILDANEIEVFVPTLKIHLPQLELFGVDVSITKHVVMMWVAALLLIGLTRVAVRQCGDPVPRGLRNAFEVLVLFIRNEVARKSIGAGADRYVPYLLTTFFFILSCNLLGLMPGAATATGNISVTAALAIVAFVVIQLGGIGEHGLIRHFANLVPHGLPFWLVPIMFVLELLSTFIKPFALCIRLFANMMAGHVVILAFISLIFILGAMFSPVVGLAASPLAVFFALFVYVLEILVAFLQAYIFTMLTANFVGMSVHPAH